MKFSTRTTYGIRAIMRLAQNYGNGMLSLPIIAESENISKSYLESIFSKLKKEGLIESTKGTDGGYKLSKSPKKTTVYDVVRVLEGNIIPFFCLSENGKIVCRLKKNCSASRVLLEVQKAINDTLKNIKLSDLIKNNK